MVIVKAAKAVWKRMQDDPVDTALGMIALAFTLIAIGMALHAKGM